MALCSGLGARNSVSLIAGEVRPNKSLNRTCYSTFGVNTVWVGVEFKFASDPVMHKVKP